MNKTTNTYFNLYDIIRKCTIGKISDTRKREDVAPTLSASSLSLISLT